MYPWLINGGDPNYLHPLGAHPPRRWLFGRSPWFISTQKMGPEPIVINGGTWGPYKWPYKCVTGVITLLIGVITQFITGRGPPCRWWSQIFCVFTLFHPFLPFFGEYSTISPYEGLVHPVTVSNTMSMCS